MTVECGVRKAGVWTFWVCDVNENKFWTPEKVEGSMSALRAFIQTGRLEMCEELKADQHKDGEKMPFCQALSHTCVSWWVGIEKRLWRMWRENCQRADWFQMAGTKRGGLAFPKKNIFSQIDKKWGQKHQYCTNLGWKMLLNLASWMVNYDSSWIVKLWSG